MATIRSRPRRAIACITCGQWLAPNGGLRYTRTLRIGGFTTCSRAGIVCAPCRAWKDDTSMAEHGALPEHSETQIEQADDTPAFLTATTADFHVVGIGASAGGLESLEKLFSHLPPDTGMAFV